MIFDESFRLQRDPVLNDLRLRECRRQECICNRLGCFYKENIMKMKVLTVYSFALTSHCFMRSKMLSIFAFYNRRTFYFHCVLETNKMA